MNIKVDTQLVVFNFKLTWCEFELQVEDSLAPAGSARTEVKPELADAVQSLTLRLCCFGVVREEGVL